MVNRFLNRGTLRPDPTNRLDVLQGGPESIAAVRLVRDQVRRALKASVRQTGLPECPRDRLHNVNDFLEAASTEVTRYWNTSGVHQRLSAQYREWAERIPSTAEYHSLKNLLEHPDTVENLLEVHQLGSLEQLREILPEAWHGLILIACERQLAKVTLARQWLRQLRDEDLQDFGMTRSEIKLFLKIAADLGKYVDHAYLKQIELADLPGGSEMTFLGHQGITGAEYVYDPYRNETGDETEIMTYSEVFPFELPKIAHHFEGLAVYVERQLEQGVLPSERYHQLPIYLRKLAAIYGSSEKDPAVLNRLWSEALSDGIRLIQEGCPMTVLPQGCASVAGEAGKVDVEVRLCIATQAERELAGVFEAFQRSAQTIVDGYTENAPNLLSKPYSVPPVVATTQPFAFGPNLHAPTQGQNNQDQIVTHTNAVEDTVRRNQLPLLRTLFPAEIDEKKYIRAAQIETGLHELGHSVLSHGDESVKERVGTSQAQALTEELKAETVNMKILRETTETSVDFHYQFLVKLGTLLDYIVNEEQESEEGSYYVGLYLLEELLAAGVLQSVEDHYQIQDPQRGIEILAQIGEDQVLKRFYLNRRSKPKNIHRNIRQFVTDLKRKTKKNRDVQALLRKAKAAQLQ